MYKFNNITLQQFAVDISLDMKSPVDLTPAQKASIQELLADNEISSKDAAYTFLNFISYEDIAVPEVREDKPTFVSDLRIWWRLILPTIQNQQLREGWEAKSAKALAFYNSNEQILRNSVVVDGKETNTFYNFAQEALAQNVITESDLDDLFQTAVSSATTKSVPFRQIDRLLGTAGNVITLSELEEMGYE